MTLVTGTRLGRYEIRSKIAEGGMGEVYLAFDTELNRAVAIKILPEAFAANEQRLRRFIQEAKTASALNHPHIVTIHEIGSMGQTRFIATEFINGETLRERIRRGSQSQNEILEIAMQTSSALADAHAAGIIHRDIKPENIMIRRDGYVKVLDFGLAKLTEPLNSPGGTDAPTRAMVHTHDGVIMGTANYMSPEQAKGIQVDARTDLWSLGVVLYEMVAGNGPFVGDTPTESISLILQKDPHSLSQIGKAVPAELERIVSKALRKDREERYQTAKDLLIDLRTLKRQLEVDAELDRTAPPEVRGTSPIRFGILPPTASVHSKPPATSAEYIVSEIKRHKIVAAIAALVVVAAVVGISRYVHSRNSEVAIESIAVLPFQNRSAEPDTEYLSDGLAESLIYRLSQIPNLKVSPTSSVFSYKNKEVDPVKVGNQLGVNAVLSGRIVQRGENLTISAELVDVRYNKLLWGEQYERKMSELLQTQREMAREIVDKLKLRVSGEEKGLAKHYTESNEAYQLHLKGRFYWNKRTVDGMHKALDYFQQAIDRDPSFALAYSGIAETYALICSPEVAGDMPANEALPKAKAAALKALEIDNSLAEPHVSLAHVAFYYDRDWLGAEREFKRVIEMNPNYATAHHWYAIYLSASGRHNEALVEMKRALELDPLSLPINVWLGRILIESGAVDQGIEHLRKTVELDPNFIQAHHFLGVAYESKGLYDDAISEFIEARKLPGGNLGSLGALAHAYAITGRREQAQKILQEVLKLSKQSYFSPTQIASIYVALGDKDEAFRWLDEADKSHDLSMVRIKQDARFIAVRSDPRFDDVVRRLGIP